MSKIADKLRSYIRVNAEWGRVVQGQPERMADAADLLDEAEKALANARETIAGLVNSRSFEGEGSADEWAAEIDITLARIRGEQ